MRTTEMTDTLERWSPYAQGVLRIVTALIYIEHGTQKLFGFPPASSPMPPAFSLFWIGGVLEMVGGFLILIGLFTRPVAFLLSGEMAVAYFQFHYPRGFWPVVNEGQPAVLYCFIWLYMSARGAGPWSLDAMLRKSG